MNWPMSHQTLECTDDLFLYDTLSPFSAINDMEVDIESEFLEIDFFDEGKQFAEESYLPQISYSDSSAFDPEEIEGVSKWYSEQSELIHRHYESNMEYQKRKLDKENEAGLLECLQQSMDFLESDHVSDFAQLSSTLSQDLAATAVIPTIMPEPELPPENEVKQTTTKDQSMKRKSQKSTPLISQTQSKKKPFVELMKHLESSESTSSTINPPNSEFKPELKLINDKIYQKKYGVHADRRKMSAPTSREVSPSPPTIVKSALRFGTAQSADKANASKTLISAKITADTGTEENTSPTDHNYCSSTNHSASGTVSKQTTSVAQSNATRVLKWQDYLQQVRAGIRSAPNSPTTSPTVLRGSARNANNFMVNGVKIPPKKNTCNIVPVASVKKNVPVAVPKQKTVLTAQDLMEMAKNKAVKGKVKLEEFDNYMARLKKNLKPNGANQRIVILPNKTTLDSKKGIPVPIKIPLNTTECSNTSTTTTIASTSKATPKMVMVKLPTVSVIHKNGQVKSAVQNTSIGANDKYNMKISDPRLLIKNNFIPKQDLKLPQMASVFKAKPVEVKSAPSNTKVTKAGVLNPVPTFKLVTAGKDSAGGSKSLILSGVTGQLKEILLTLAKQQNKDKATLLNKAKSKEVVSDDRQQKTLQHLLSAISKLNAPKPKVVSTEPPTSNQAVTLQPKNTTSNKAVSNNLNVGVKPITSTPTTQPVFTAVTIPVIKNVTKSIVPILAPKHVDKPQTNHSEPVAKPSTLIAVENTHQSGAVMQKLPESLETKPQTIEIMDIDNISSSVVYPKPSTLSLSVPTQASLPAQEEVVNSSKGALQSNLVSSTSTEEIPNVDTMPNESNIVPESLSNPKSPFASLEEKEEDHPVITLEDAMASLEDDGLLNSCDDEEPVKDSSLYSKLPSYLTTGKLVTKKEYSDGELMSESEEGFDKLPHYFSSGKTTGEVDTSTRVKPEKMEDETFYSRLPSYYSYGRCANVKTFNDDLQSESSEIPTKSCPKSKTRKRKLKKNKSTQSKKRKSSSPAREKSVMFSKLPSYCLSGKLDKSGRRGSRKRYLSTSSSSYSDRSRSRSSSSSRHSSKSSYCTTTTSDSDSDRRYKRRSSRQKSYRTRSRRDRDYGRSKRKYSKYSDDENTDSKKQHAIEERRVVYVGKISKSTTKRDLRSRFERFGEIVTITLHFRENSDSYGFITYVYTSDAFRAIEEGNNNLRLGEPYYELCFGGRREFCKVAYADLDDAPDTLSHDKFGNNEEDDFDSLLKMAQRGLH